MCIRDSFRVWAPRPQTIVLVLEDPGGSRDVPLEPEGEGYYSVSVRSVRAGQRYRYRLDEALLPDPASRAQPDGPFGPSEVVDPARFEWTDTGWPGVAREGQI